MKTCFSNLQEVAKTVLRGKQIAIQAYLKKQEVSNTQPNPTPKGAGKGIANKAYRRREKIKMRAEINNTETTKQQNGVTKLRAGSLK